MTTATRNALMLALIAGTSGWALASQSLQQRLTPAQIDKLPAELGGTGTSLVGSMRTTVLYGDPGRPGLYTIRIHIPAHTTIRPHRHRDTRAAVVVSGTWYFGYGAKLNPAALKALPPGSFYTEPGNIAHFAETRDEPVVVFITGYGPSDTKYVNEQDRPTP